MPTPTVARPYFRLRNKLAPRDSAAGPWKVADLCRAYTWPTKAPGTTKPIGIYEASGGWTAADLAAFGIANSLPSVPTITDVSVDGTVNTPGGDADGEVALDLELVWASYWSATLDPATGAGLLPSIRVYWGQDLAAAITRAAADGCGVFSISWGTDEANWGAAACQAIEAAAAAALASTGMITFAAAGDNDSSDGGPSAANVDCPASCPSIVACGGTSKPQAGVESVWNNEPGQSSGSGTGGGYSTVFPMPAWQSTSGAPADPGSGSGSGTGTGSGRMVPDVAACADPNTGYEIYFGGSPQVVGGTSAVAPLYAGLFAALGLQGDAGAALWAPSARACFVDITTGDNGAYRAQVGPDPCTGLGVPNGAAIAALFAPAPAAA